MPKTTNTDPQPCQFCGAEFLNLHNHLKITHGRNLVYECEKCMKKFPTPTKLKAHMPMHLEKTKKCQDCEKIFKTQHQLSKHRSEQHPTPDQLKKWIKCDHCERKFYRKERLDSHVFKDHVVHNPQNLMSCGHCSYTTTKLKSLKAHWANSLCCPNSEINRQNASLDNTLNTSSD